MTTMEIPLTRGMVALIDAEDYEKIGGAKYKWSFLMRGREGYKQPCAIRSYTIGYKKTKMKYLHRVIMDAPDGMVVDHINGDGLDNRKCNLRVCTQQQNSMNQHKNKWKGATYRGRRQTKSGKITIPHWQAFISVKINGTKRFISLGCYKTAKEAASVYNVAAKHYFGEYACLNDLSKSY